jgi:hypothetical protein
MHISYIIYGLLILLISWFIYNIIKTKFQKRLCKKALITVFSKIKIELPSLIIGSSYWYPQLDLIFKNKDDYEFASKNSLFKDFEDKIQMIFSDIKDFDANRAVNYKYMGMDSDNTKIKH